MKRLFLLSSLIVSFLIIATSAYALEAAMGQNIFAVKLDYIKFTDSEINEIGDGVYIGAEGYGDIGYNFYLGGEVGYTNFEGDPEEADPGVEKELIYIPVELNLKYIVMIIPGLTADFGGGFSYNYAKEEFSTLPSSESEDDWVWGGQLFVDANYRIKQVFFGVNAKYQNTQEGGSLRHDFDNWRVGGQFGVVF